METLDAEILVSLAVAVKQFVVESGLDQIGDGPELVLRRKRRDVFLGPEQVDYERIPFFGSLQDMGRDIGSTSSRPQQEWSIATVKVMTLF